MTERNSATQVRGLATFFGLAQASLLVACSGSDGSVSGNPATGGANAIGGTNLTA